MVNYRYLGYGITNDKGIAKLEFDANGNPIDHSYTGTGAGELDIIASLDDNTHISDSSIQSETFPVDDTLFYDIGTSANHNDNWSSTSDFDRQSDGTLYTATTWTTRSIQINSSDNIPLTNGMKIVFDVVAIGSESGTRYFTVRDSTNFRNLPITAIGQYEIVLTDKVRMYRDGSSTPVTESEYNTTDTTVKLGFVGTSGSPTLKFKDLKVYS